MGITDIFTPNPSVNYKFISYAYLFLISIAIILYLIETNMQVTGIEGMWIIPTPAVLGLLYVTILRSRQSNTKKYD